MDDWLVSLASSWWVYPGMFAFAFVDGFFPPMPSEIAILGLTATAVAAGAPDLALILLVAALGAWLGDLVAYATGRAVDPHRVPLLRHGRGRALLDWAERSLERRGTSFILAGRFVPAARVVISLAAGALGFPPRRYVPIAAVGALTWAAYSAVIGIGAGAWLAGRPAAAAAVGVVAGLGIGVPLDWALGRAQRRRAARDASTRADSGTPVP